MPIPVETIHASVHAYYTGRRYDLLDAAVEAGILDVGAYPAGHRRGRRGSEVIGVMSVCAGDDR